jgi:hypothetical protein
MTKDIAIVSTTIGDGTFLDHYAKTIAKEDARDRTSLIVIPDRKTPEALSEKADTLTDHGFDVRCPSIDEQEAFLDGVGRMGELIPYNSDNRRNVGYLMALDQGADVVVSVDDDNFPQPDHGWIEHHSLVGEEIQAPAVHSSNGWYNICERLEVDPVDVYPRGFPYHARHQDPEIHETTETGTVHANAGLWLGHPDVDAATCLIGDLESTAFTGESLLLGEDTWCPINSQNTAIAAEAMPAYYFLRMGFPVLGGLPIARDGDIFQGLFLQACAKHLGNHVRVGTPIVDHDRNVHDYLGDLTGELACMRMLEDVTQWLTDVELDGDDYAETYLSLADALNAEAERFEGDIWTPAARSYLHTMADHMHAWVEAVDTVT